MQNSTTFAKYYSLEKIAKFLILQNWGKLLLLFLKDLELGMKKITNFN